MSDNNGSQFATRDIRTHDLVTGEELMIAFFPRAGVVTINGYSVNRSQKFEDLDENAVFLRTLDDKLFTVSTDSLGELFF